MKVIVILFATLVTLATALPNRVPRFPCAFSNEDPGCDSCASYRDQRARCMCQHESGKQCDNVGPKFEDCKRTKCKKRNDSGGVSAALENLAPRTPYMEEQGWCDYGNDEPGCDNCIKLRDERASCMCNAKTYCGRADKLFASLSKCINTPMSQRVHSLNAGRLPEISTPCKNVAADE